MQADCKAQGVPLPVLRYEKNGLWVKFKNRVPGKTPGKMPGKMPGKTPMLILSQLRLDPNLTIPELVELVGRSERAVERAIRKLRESGRLKRIGSAKGGHWQVMGKNDE